TRNAAHVLPEGGLEAKLKLGRPLRVKMGIDVTAPDVTLGNGIPLQRMRAFQDEGHTGVLIVGDYTTRIGDPSGRKTERPMIEPEVIDANAQRYFGRKEAPAEQFGKAMRIPDSLLPQWYRLVMERDDVPSDPFEAKLELARFIVQRAWGEEAARAAEEHFTRVVREGQAPDEVA